MASSSSLEDAVTELMDSPGGQLLNSARGYLRRRAMALLGLFLTGLVLGFPIAKRIVTWLIEEQRLPDDVNVIVTSPVEFLMLQIQLSASFGLFLALLLVITETTLRGVRHPLVLERFKEVNIRPPKPSFSFFIAIGSSLLLAICGVLYAWELLTPMLFEYLSNDAQQAGLSTQWKLGAYVGFILNLCIASAIGFQAPVLTLLALRIGLVEPPTLVAYRKHIWFAAFVMGAIFSPPDPLSLFLVSLPVILLFETALLVHRIMPMKSTQVNS
ncbi:MAG: twin-arginine translocase subunit TatC [Candidatus Poseidoniaceae archaeon]